LAFVDVNDLAVERYGYSREQFLSMSLLEIRPDNDERAIVEAMVRNTGNEIYAGDRSFQHQRSDGELIDVKIVSVPTVHRGRPSHLVVVTDVTAQLFLHDAIKHAADSDGLTGLANRREFVRLLGTQLKVSPTDSVAVSFIDLDRFKLVNDSMGHDTGDALLGAAAARIREQTPTALLLARLGGDEFAVLNHVSDASVAFEQAQRIRESLERPFQLKGYELVVSASIGVAVSEPDSTAQGLLSQADAAMYAAKEAGRNGCVVFDQALRDRTAEWAQVQRDLGRAIDDGQFELHLQRIHRPGREAEGAIAYEALARWKHPERGVLAPGSFIGVAEESGLIVQLGTHLLKIGAAHAAALDAPVCVNVSARQFNRALVDDVEHLIDLHRLRPGQLVIEITESAVIDAAYAQTVLHGLRRAGAQIWIDDFGTGFSSLARLSSLTVDGLKLDRRFVHDLDSERGWGIATAITGIARALDIIIVAEGVETERQLERVRELGCHAVQGYHLGHPEPAEHEIERLAAEPHRQLAGSHPR
jgi:diguanylate cyclase (GGDEF)-like protein/PAS domain S-box-containing protein